jgi:hypothetical protein
VAQPQLALALEAEVVLIGGGSVIHASTVVREAHQEVAGRLHRGVIGSGSPYVRGMTDHSADVAAITRLKYRYLRLLDTKQWDEFATCFAPDATADYGGLAFADPTALVDYMRGNVGEGVITMHQAHHPEIDVDPDDPDRASGTWYLHDKVIVDAFRFALEGGAIYRDRYVPRTRAGGSRTPATPAPSSSPGAWTTPPGSRSAGRAPTPTRRPGHKALDWQSPRRTRILEN